MLSPTPCLDGQSILVTGATGSFGKRFVQTVLQTAAPRRLIVFSRDELKQSQMAEQFPPSQHACIEYILGDVRDRSRLELGFRDVDIVIHAAALKQVPASESNPFEYVQTNVLGAENIVQAALRSQVKKVIGLSTSKAVNPANLYGATKLAADKLFIAANQFSRPEGPIFSVVRSGNVLGSRGSVVPLFQRLIRDGAPSLPITHPSMTRFWITLQQCVDFAIACLPNMQGGEIFVPKIPSMSIVDVATALAPNLPRKVVGVRPGEKLHESLISEDESASDQGAHYIVLPRIPLPARKYFHSLNCIPPGFSYASNTNPMQLDAPAFLKLLAADLEHDNSPSFA